MSKGRDLGSEGTWLLALEAPFHQIITNAGIKVDDVLNEVIGHKERGYGFQCQRHARMAI